MAAVQPLTLDASSGLFSDGFRLSFQINKMQRLSDVKLHDESGWRSLQPQHLAVVLFRRAVSVRLPLITDTGTIDKTIQMPAGTTVSRFLVKVMQAMNRNVTIADARRLTGGYATSAKVKMMSAKLRGLKYRQLPMDHVHFEGVSRARGALEIELGS